ncbi:MAG: metal-dependent transcriptional regulator [Saprospiraceae bacterium]|jgi:DtxR family Mn-dependent transcriptional regulator|nr:metal-dependent transcriptional regulator [Saprospiraceae bacterium]
METLTQAEENYLKAIFKITEKEGKSASTNAIAAVMNTSAASVTDMLKRLAGKHLLHYEKHRGVALSERGNELATNLVRKHRLWEVFLVKMLDFSWDQVHDIAEQLEHVQSEELVERLDAYLERPQFDPHGDPIPNAEGKMATRKQVLLSALAPGDAALLVGVQESTATFLQYLDRMRLSLGTGLRVKERFDYDGSMSILLNGNEEITISHKVCENLFVQKSK